MLGRINLKFDILLYIHFLNTSKLMSDLTNKQKHGTKNLISNVCFFVCFFFNELNLQPLRSLSFWMKQTQIYYVIINKLTKYFK